MDKHAYLIIAHNDYLLLNHLLAALDDSRNELFLHIDRKSSFDPKVLYKPKSAKMVLAPRIKVEWGGDTQVKCELNLLQLAVSTGYHAYYHLLSGADLPLKTQDEIHKFFAENEGKNYLDFDDEQYISDFVETRIKEYHFFQNAIGRKRGHVVACFSALERWSLRLQKGLGVDRTVSYNGQYYKGAQWFSITHELAETVLAQQETIRKYFYCSLCADEMFLHTIVMNSPLKSSVVYDNLRFIDWDRGQPYTFTREDKELLLNSGKLFARKFSTAVDRNIIEELLFRIGICPEG